MKYGIKKKHIANVKDIFAGHKEIESVILYGSRAKGNYRPGSDIDLTLKGKNMNLSLLNKISIELDDLFLPYTFDLSIFDQIDNSDLLEHIERVGMVFWSRP
jgi:predicted nucleotidyltransferase